MNRAVSPPGRRCHSCFPDKFKQCDSKELPVASSTDVLPVASSWELCVSEEKVGVVQYTVLWCNSACKISKGAQMLEAHPASVVFLQRFWNWRLSSSNEGNAQKIKSFAMTGSFVCPTERAPMACLDLREFLLDTKPK